MGDQSHLKIQWLVATQKNKK